jgi:cell division protein FtsZ
VNNMIAAHLEGVEFWIANTDAQALENALTNNRIQLGVTSTQGLGAGSHPEVGKKAAEESLNEINAVLEGSNMVFITAGMGGGTGTGAAPVIARLAKERNILTVGVVTKPFHFEGVRRMKVAEQGLQEMQKYVDTLIVIPNQNLFRLANENTTFADAFKMADNVLHSGVRGVTDLITMTGLINLDFADIRTVMSEMGKAMMGTGEAEGEDRAIKAAEAAISNPLLDNTSMKGAKGVLINITGGLDMTLFEVDEAANRIKEEVDPEANIIFGSAFNNNLEGKLRVSVVATGIASHEMKHLATSPISAMPPLVKPKAVEPEERKAFISPLDDVFIPPKASQPSLINGVPAPEFAFAESRVEAASTTATPTPSDLFNPNTANEEEEAEEAPNIAPLSAHSRFQGEHDEDAPANTIEEIPTEVETSERKKDDFFDIPAFLRRRMRK